MCESSVCEGGGHSVNSSGCSVRLVVIAQEQHTEQVFSIGPKSPPPGGRDKADFSADASSFLVLHW